LDRSIRIRRNGNARTTADKLECLYEAIDVNMLE